MNNFNLISKQWIFVFLWFTLFICSPINLCLPQNINQFTQQIKTDSALPNLYHWMERNSYICEAGAVFLSEPEAIQFNCAALCGEPMETFRACARKQMSEEPSCEQVPELCIREFIQEFVLVLGETRGEILMQDFSLSQLLSQRDLQKVSKREEQLPVKITTEAPTTTTTTISTTTIQPPSTITAAATTPKSAEKTSTSSSTTSTSTTTNPTSTTTSSPTTTAVTATPTKTITSSTITSRPSSSTTTSSIITVTMPTTPGPSSFRTASPTTSTKPMKKITKALSTTPKMSNGTTIGRITTMPIATPNSTTTTTTATASITLTPTSPTTATSTVGTTASTTVKLLTTSKSTSTSSAEEDSRPNPITGEMTTQPVDGDVLSNNSSNVISARNKDRKNVIGRLLEKFKAVVSKSAEPFFKNVFKGKLLPTNNKKGCPPDGHDSCKFWARVGECFQNPRYMLTICKRACGVCQPQKSIQDEIKLS